MTIFHCAVVYSRLPFTRMGTVLTTWSLVAREPGDTMKKLTKLTSADDQMLHTVDN